MLQANLVLLVLEAYISMKLGHLKDSYMSLGFRLQRHEI